MTHSRKQNRNPATTAFGYSPPSLCSSFFVPEYFPPIFFSFSFFKLLPPPSPVLSLMVDTFSFSYLALSLSSQDWAMSKANSAKFDESIISDLIVVLMLNNASRKILHLCLFQQGMTVPNCGEVTFVFPDYELVVRCSYNGNGSTNDIINYMEVLSWFPLISLVNYCFLALSCEHSQVYDTVQSIVYTVLLTSSNIFKISQPYKSWSEFLYKGDAEGTKCQTEPQYFVFNWLLMSHNRGSTSSDRVK